MNKLFINDMLILESPERFPFPLVPGTQFEFRGIKLYLAEIVYVFADDFSQVFTNVYLRAKHPIKDLPHLEL